jgi:hypothetical protein
MTEMFDHTILEILQQATIAAVEASTVPELPIKFVSAPNAFIVPDDQKYLEIVWIPNNRDNDHWGNEKNYQGMFRLVLHWPNNGAGAYAPLQALASVCGYFDKETRLQNVTISANPNSGGVIEQGTECLYPAAMRYQCFRP